MSGYVQESCDITWLFEKTYTPKIKVQKVDHYKNNQNKVIVLAGPTAVGKTKLSIELARLLGGEVVCADSMQVYKHMDVGTAKPTPGQQIAVMHHMLDICEVNEVYNAAEYARDAKKAISSILSRNRVPIVVGGSGFYLHCLLYGAPQGPSSDPSIRLHLETELELMGAEWLYDKLYQKDPEYAVKITKADKHKIIRALEIITLTGFPVSHFKWNEDKKFDQFNYHCFFLTRPKEKLNQMIALRAKEMLEHGLVDEVDFLLDKGLLHNKSAATAIGYKQVIEYLQNPNQRKENLLEAITIATRQYAKRQLTWFRKEKDFQWLDLDLLKEDEVIRLISEDFQKFNN